MEMSLSILSLPLQFKFSMVFLQFNWFRIGLNFYEQKCLRYSIMIAAPKSATLMINSFRTPYFNVVRLTVFIVKQLIFKEAIIQIRTEGQLRLHYSTLNLKVKHLNKTHISNHSLINHLSGIYYFHFTHLIKIIDGGFVDDFGQKAANCGGSNYLVQIDHPYNLRLQRSGP